MLLFNLSYHYSGNEDFVEPWLLLAVLTNFVQRTSLLKHIWNKLNYISVQMSHMDKEKKVSIFLNVTGGKTNSILTDLLVPVLKWSIKRLLCSQTKKWSDSKAFIVGKQFDTVEITQGIEAKEQHTQQLKNEEVIKQVSPANCTVSCKYCGKNNRHASKYQTICNTCHKKEHLAKICRAQWQQQLAAPKKKVHPDKGTMWVGTKQATENRDTDSELPLYKINDGVSQCTQSQ